MMKYSISREEFAVLTFLHEHAESYDEQSSFKLEGVGTATGMTTKEVFKAGSYLSSLGFAHLTTPRMVTFNTEGQRLIYLTGDGERFMRELEDQLGDEIEKAEPSRARKITVKIATAVYDVGKNVITKVLSEMMIG